MGNKDEKQKSDASIQVINKFRTDVESMLQTFKQDYSQTEIKIPIAMSNIIKNLSNEEKRKVTKDVLKYIVYEQSDEIGEGTWVAAKEQSEFMDECTIIVYKDGHAPPEVLEDMFKGELPDEVKQQQQATRQLRMKEITRKDYLERTERHKHSIQKVDDFATLNVKKRDLRTISEIQ